MKWVHTVLSMLSACRSLGTHAAQKQVVIVVVLAAASATRYILLQLVKHVEPDYQPANSA